MTDLEILRQLPESAGVLLSAWCLAKISRCEADIRSIQDKLGVERRPRAKGKGAGFLLLVLFLVVLANLAAGCAHASQSVREQIQSGNRLVSVCEAWPR